MASFFSLSRRRKPALPAQSFRKLAIETLEFRLPLSVNVLNYHYDNTSSGLNDAETQLTPANVNTSTFGKLYTAPLDGNVYAEPLVETGVTIAAGVNTTAGAAGVHDVVFVATENDSIYAIDSSTTGTGAVLWQRSFLNTTNAGGDINNTLGATAITAVPDGDTGSNNIEPTIGITGTPVIDPNTGTLYVVVKTEETIGGNAYYVQRLHAINIADGTDVATPYLIGSTTDGNTNNTQIYCYGTGDGAVTDPYNGTGQDVVQFNALREAQRPALSLVNGTVYVEWASHGDNGPYHGWVATWNVSNLSTSGFVLSGVFCTSPNDGESGIWMGGGQAVFEPNDSAFYVVTGNGTGGAPVLNAAGFPTNDNYNEAVVKLEADSTTSPTDQNGNGWGLKVVDYFIPYNVAALDGADSDFGSGGLMLLTTSGVTGYPDVLLASGKEGKIYVINRDNMGHFDPNNDDVLNAVPDGSGQNTPPVQISGSLSTPAYYNGTIYWVSGYNSYAYAYTLNSNGTLSVDSQTAIGNFGYLPGSVVVSSDGTSNGVVWIMDTNANEIHAYSASTLATELWNSGQKSGGVDNLGAAVKFAVPTVANGEVFVGTSDSLVVYGLTQPPTAVPNQPTLAAAPLSGSSVNLTWTDTTMPPNLASGYTIEYSTDGTNFSTITTAPAGDFALRRRFAAHDFVLFPHLRVQPTGRFARLERGQRDHHYVRGRDRFFGRIRRRYEHFDLERFGGTERFRAGTHQWRRRRGRLDLHDRAAEYQQLRHAIHIPNRRRQQHGRRLHVLHPGRRPDRRRRGGRRPGLRRHQGQHRHQVRPLQQQRRRYRLHRTFHGRRRSVQRRLGRPDQYRHQPAQRRHHGRQSEL